MCVALEALWPFASELFEADGLTAPLVDIGVAVDPGALRREWEEAVSAALAEATLPMPETAWLPTGGRRGLHTEPFGHMLAEMQSMHRAHPGVAW